MIQTAELYIGNSWIFTDNNMTQHRTYHAAVLLNDGSLLIVGGGNDGTTAYTNVEEDY
jgi:hypothetical protein